HAIVVGRVEQRKPIENADRARMAVEQLSKVRLAQPSIGAHTDLDADELGDVGRSTEPRCEEDLTEAALAEQALNPVRNSGFGADDGLRRAQQQKSGVRRTQGASGCRRRSSRHENGGTILQRAVRYCLGFPALQESAI